MDYDYLYEQNKKYGKALCEDEKAYLHGFNAAAEEIETFLANYDCYESVEEEVSPTLARIVTELREDVMKNFRDWLNSSWKESFISFLDNSEGDDNTGKLSQKWKIPEPPKTDDDSSSSVSKDNEEHSGI